MKNQSILKNDQKPLLEGRVRPDHGLGNFVPRHSNASRPMEEDSLDVLTFVSSPFTKNLLEIFLTSSSSLLEHGAMDVATHVTW